MNDLPYWKAKAKWLLQHATATAVATAATTTAVAALTTMWLRRLAIIVSKYYTKARKSELGMVDGGLGTGAEVPDWRANGILSWQAMTITATTMQHHNYRPAPHDFTNPPPAQLT